MAKVRKNAAIRPAEERIKDNATAKGKALKLSPSERATLAHRKKMDQALVLFVEGSLHFPEIAAQVGLDLEVLQRYAQSEAFPVFRDAVFEKVAEMYLDYNGDWSVVQIASVLGMSERQLRYMTSTKEFLAKYKEIYGNVTEDIGPLSVQRKLLDLLPDAFKTLKWELSDDAPATVRQRARQDVFKLAGVAELQPRQSDREEAARFLAGMSVGTLNINVAVPSEYQEALVKYLPEVVDVSPTPDHPGPPPESDPEGQSQ